jgi:hypothetical protein
MFIVTVTHNDQSESVRAQLADCGRRITDLCPLDLCAPSVLR